MIFNYESQVEGEEDLQGLCLERWYNLMDEFDGSDEYVWRVSRCIKDGGLPAESIKIVDLVERLDSRCTYAGFQCGCDHDCCGHMFSSGAWVEFKDRDTAYIRMSVGRNY